MLIYTILIMHPPYNIKKSIHAFYVVNSLVKQKKNHIKNIFFYGDGVFYKNFLVEISNENVNIVHQWYELSKNFSITLNFCSRSIQERGILSNNINKNMELSHDKLDINFKITGLGMLVQSILDSDRLLQL